MTAKKFNDKMLIYLKEYHDYLLPLKSGNFTASHYAILQEFISYIYDYHLVSSIDQITVSIANSKFQAYFKAKNKETISKESFKKIIKGYFIFLKEKHEMTNDKLMRGLN